MFLINSMNTLILLQIFFHVNNFILAISKPKKYIETKFYHRYYDIEFVSVFEVKKIIKQMHSHKSSCNVGVGPDILSIVVTPQPRRQLIQKSHSLIFPDSIKDANVIPVFKDRIKADPNTTRTQSCISYHF